MNFDLKVALTIATERGLSESTIKNWQAQGVIPDKYFATSKILVMGYTLYEARLKAGLSQRDVFDAMVARLRANLGADSIISLTYQQISVWELGKRKPHPTYQTLLIAVLSDALRTKGIEPKAPDRAN